MCLLASLFVLSCVATMPREGEQTPIVVATVVQTRIDDDSIKLHLQALLGFPEECITIKRDNNEQDIAKNLEKGRIDYVLISSHWLQTSPLKKFHPLRKFSYDGVDYVLLHKLY
ncbi:hypothetical protein L6279_05220 [Candidatus Parcubacteria bacterium]|nr:hypothetical protein [Candidatus Parcubacteria bacterium]